MTVYKGHSDTPRTSFSDALHKDPPFLLCTIQVTKPVKRYIGKSHISTDTGSGQATAANAKQAATSVTFIFVTQNSVGNIQHLS
jgi:hypothetical protein